MDHTTCLVFRVIGSENQLNENDDHKEIFQMELHDGADASPPPSPHLKMSDSHEGPVDKMDPTSSIGLRDNKSPEKKKKKFCAF